MTPHSIRNLLLCTFFIAAMAGIQPSKPAAPIAANPDCANFLPYATDPNHIWNRVHRQLSLRRDINGKTWGCDDVDPLLWQTTKHVLESPAYQETVRLLDEFTSTHAETLIRDPLPRALFQRDLWAVFSWLGSTTEDHRQERAELDRRLAVIIKAMALTQPEIQGLPDNYLQVRGLKTSDGLALPDNSGDWLLIGRDDGKPAARFHSIFFSRSMFLVYLKLPPGATDAGKYLEAMRAYVRQRPKTDDCQQHPCSPPQFPVGTELALVRRAILMDSTNRPVVSPITESIQLRRYISVPAGKNIDYDGGTQQVAELQLTRSGFPQATIALRQLGNDETQFRVFMTHGIDAFEGTEASTGTPGVVLQACHACHQGTGVISFTTYSRVQAERDLFVPVHLTTEENEAAITIKFLQKSNMWKLLQKCLQIMKSAATSRNPAVRPLPLVFRQKS